MMIAAMYALGLIAAPMAASAATFTFPGSDSSWHSATNGNGTGLPSATMWTGGDYISYTANAPGVVSVSQLSYSFSVVDLLQTTSETLDILINGTLVDTQAVLGCSLCGSESLFSNTVTFAPIFGIGSYTLEIELSSTVPPQGGAVFFDTAGSFTLSTPTAAPEPVSLALIGVGLAGLGAARRRSRG